MAGFSDAARYAILLDADATRYGPGPDLTVRVMAVPTVMSHTVPYVALFGPYRWTSFPSGLRHNTVNSFGFVRQTGSIQGSFVRRITCILHTNTGYLTRVLLKKPTFVFRTSPYRNADFC